ncbi:hypothetical protein KV572_24980 [Pseudomonas yamanorum]|uniref:hypothetical protein n=1 Tax=Pseudomonas yamanorum TaxID=515393 RepID=UPI001C46B14C|nr:hypothetical protein [Pseudomonas yamanorum]MBV6664216.1 hypothetical protein [Pseudomonas yamanorum]
MRKLSAVLRAFPHHSIAARQESFRSADGVAFKLQNLRNVATGAGLKNTSKIDREVWEEFGGDAARTLERANLIRHSVAIIDDLPLPEEDEEFWEGGKRGRIYFFGQLILPHFLSLKLPKPPRL